MNEAASSWATETLAVNCWMVSCKCKPLFLSCRARVEHNRRARVEHNTIATRILDRIPEELSAATPENEAMTQLKDWVLVLKHLDNLEAVRACAPLCAVYNKGLCSALLAAASAGKHSAIPLLAGVFRCSVPPVSCRMAFRVSLTSVVTTVVSRFACWCLPCCCTFMAWCTDTAC